MFDTPCNAKKSCATIKAHLQGTQNPTHKSQPCKRALICQRFCPAFVFQFGSTSTHWATGTIPNTYAHHHPHTCTTFAPMTKYKFLITLTILIFSTQNIIAQNTFTATVKDSSINQTLQGTTAKIKDTKITATADSNGIIILKNIPNGKQTIVFSYVGYKKIELQITFPLSSNAIQQNIYLNSENEELNQVIVSSTKTSRTIANTPTRVETIDGEELDEKNNMKPSNVSMLLHESTGLQVQQTSATSGSASIRVQGLDGRYTQLLKDGYANFGNFASGLSILQIAPLDLKQVEVIKGPASTLFGGGAIAGVINFISKAPKEKAEHSFLFNQSHIGQTDVSVYSSHKKGKFGYAVLAMVNFQKPYDVDKDNFTEVPKTNSVTFNPRFYYYPNSTTTFMLGNSFTQSNNKGGDLQVINGNTDANHVYFEENNSKRNTTFFEFDKKFSTKNSFKLKQSLSFFDRKLSIPNYSFAGLNTNSFSDITYISNLPKQTIITGINVVFDKFKQQNSSTAIHNLNNQSFTTGAYVQHTWDVSNKTKIESGLRIENANYSNINFNNNQTFALPRISVLFKFNNKITSRIGGGLGYKIPTVFTEKTESLQYQNVLPLNNVSAEKSIGATADINYKTKLADEVSFSINQMFFYTSISNPLILLPNSLTNVYYTNATQPLHSMGFETNVKLIIAEDFKIFAGYTYTYAKAMYQSGNQFVTLTPKGRLNFNIVYEEEDNFKIAIEGLYTGKQFLNNGNETPSFWEIGVAAQKTFNKVAIFLNCENFNDQRQSKYKSVVNGNINNPSFDDIWNNTLGFVFNAGFKIKL